MDESKTMTTIASCRLNVDQMRKLDAKAKEKGIPRSMMIKYIILEYLDKDLVHQNLLQSQMIKVMEKIDNTSTKLEFFQQMFYSWLVTWFASHPKIEDASNKIVNQALNRRKTFTENFISDIYNNGEELFETLFANSAESQEDEEE